MHKNTGNLSVKYPRKKILNWECTENFHKVLFTVPNIGAIRPEVNQYSVQN